MLWKTLQHFKVDIYMKYDPIPSPREYDELVMNIIMSTGKSKAWKASMNRCRGYLGIMFLSDMSTADSKHLEQFTFDHRENSTSSSYKFPRKDQQQQIGNDGVGFGSTSPQQEED
jgi:hypothetical protein